MGVACRGVGFAPAVGRGRRSAGGAARAGSARAKAAAPGRGRGGGRTRGESERRASAEPGHGGRPARRKVRGRGGGGERDRGKQLARRLQGSGRGCAGVALGRLQRALGWRALGGGASAPSQQVPKGGARCRCLEGSLWASPLEPLPCAGAPRLPGVSVPGRAWGGVTERDGTGRAAGSPRAPRALACREGEAGLGLLRAAGPSSLRDGAGRRPRPGPAVSRGRRRRTWSLSPRNVPGPVAKPGSAGAVRCGARGSALPASLWAVLRRSAGRLQTPARMDRTGGGRAGCPEGCQGGELWPRTPRGSSAARTSAAPSAPSCARFKGLGAGAAPRGGTGGSRSQQQQEPQAGRPGGTGIARAGGSPFRQGQRC